MTAGLSRSFASGRRAPLRPAHGGGDQAQAEIQWKKGVAASDLGEWDRARRHFERAVKLSPEDSVFWLNLAQAHRKLGELPAAETSARKAFALNPASGTACFFLGSVLADQRRFAAACEVFESLPPSVERDHEFYCAFGEALHRSHRHTEATGQFINAFTCKPDHVPAHLGLSNAFKTLGMYTEAAECLRTVTMIRPWDAMALGHLIHQNQNACRWDSLDRDIVRLRELVESPDSTVTAPFIFLMIESSARLQRLVTERAAQFEFRSIKTLPSSPRAGSRESGRIRVGYVSSDFRHHATAMLITEVLERHDRERFEIFLYSCAPDDGTAWRKRVEASSEHWVDVAEMSDDDIARRIRADEIDIAVDLKGFTNDTRLHVFARRPAPIQVTWLGYPGTTGTNFVDYVIGDPVVTPESDQPFFTERIAQMPWCYQPNDRRRPLGGTLERARYGLPEKAFVFSSFNNNYKITPAVFDRWCNLLKAVPGSVLWLFEASGQSSDNLLAEAEKRGVGRDRLVFAPFVSQEEHLARLPAADLFLDTLPCNAHTTASDALWAGLPVVTCVGQTFVGRVAASLLRAVGLQELITDTMDDYEALALALARQPERLQAIRSRLEGARLQAPLFDSEGFARDIEALYLRMYERHEGKRQPATLLAVEHGA